MKDLSRRALFGTSLGLASLAAGRSFAQATNWSDIQAAARKEGRVVLYTDMVPAVTAFLKPDFEAANPGITLEVARLFGPVQVNKIDEERINNIDGADVAVGTEVLVWYSKVNQQGLLRKPVGPAVKTWPATYLYDGVCSVLTLEPLLVTYNTELIKQPITSYQQILEPQYKGKIGISEPVAAAVLAWYDWLERTQGPEYLGKLAAQNPHLYVGSVPTTQAAASGEAPIAAFSNPSSTKPMMDQGAPLKMFLSNPGFGIRYAGAIVGWSRRPNAAQVLMDYLMSPRGQTAWSGHAGTASPLPNIPGALSADVINPYDPNQYNSGSVAAYQPKWNALFRKGG